MESICRCCWMGCNFTDMMNINEIKEWINHLNKETHVQITESQLSTDSFWFYDKKTGRICNQNNSFFSIAGIKGKVDNREIEQPILLQNEIGYLGIICKMINNELHYLMQAKIEPGNINCVQISPTIQATKSNFMQKHGGAKPLYLDYFLNAHKYKIIADQIHSEQSSRFYRKRNRNMIILVDEDVKAEERFCWMTLPQLKELMREKNLVNMDTRTVLSCLPYIEQNPHLKIERPEFRRSVCYSGYIQEIVDVFHKINNYKMFCDNTLDIVRLDELDSWMMDERGIRCRHEYPYQVIYCDIEIEGREVKKWMQPLFKANGKAMFGLIYTVDNGVMKFLIKLQPEIGCFDHVELGPTIQKESNELMEDPIEILFEKNLMMGRTEFDTILSEEGGRFYHEENRNIVMNVSKEELGDIPSHYHLLTYAALNHLNMINNCLNIQLRNLLSTLEV